MPHVLLIRLIFDSARATLAVLCACACVRLPSAIHAFELLLITISGQNLPSNGKDGSASPLWLFSLLAFVLIKQRRWPLFVRQRLLLDVCTMRSGRQEKGRAKGQEEDGGAQDFCTVAVEAEAERRR